MIYETEEQLMSKIVISEKKEEKKEEKFMSFEDACKIVKACVDSECEWIEVEENNPEEIKRIKKAWKKIFEIAKEYEKGWE